MKASATRPPWPEPLDPLDVLPPWCATEVVALSAGAQADPYLVAMLALAIGAGALGGRVIVEAGNNPVAMWVMATAPPASGKTLALAELTRPLRDHEEWRIDHANGNGGGPSGKLMLSDTTPEALVVQAQESDGRMLLVSDEATLIESLTGYREHSPAIGALNSGWSGSVVSLARVTRADIWMPRFVVNLALAVQPSVGSALFALKGASSRGFLSRWLHYAADRPRQTLSIANTDTAPRWYTAIRTLAERFHPYGAAPRCVSLRMTAEAVQLWHEFHDAVEDRVQAGYWPDDGLIAAAGRMRYDHVSRLAGLLHILDDPTGGWEMVPIGTDAMERAIAHVAWHIDRLPTVYGDRAVRADDPLARLHEALRRRGAMTRNDVYDLYGRGITKRDVDDLAASAVDAGWATEEVVKDGSPGRPPKVLTWVEKTRTDA